MSNPRCRAQSKQAKRQCLKTAEPGATVCYIHGGRAPQVKRKAAVRVALAEAIANGDRRPAAQIMLDALHTADVLMRQAQIVAVDSGEPVPVEVLDGLVQAVARAAAMARVVVDSGVDQQLRKITEEQVDSLHKIMMEVFGRWPEFRSRDEPLFRRLLREVILWVAGGGPAPAPVVLPHRPPLRRKAIEASRPVRPAAGSAPPDAPVDSPSSNGRRGRSGRAEEATVDAVLVDAAESLPMGVPPLRVVAEVRSELPQYSRCDGCGGMIEPQAQHDQQCGWSQVKHRGGWSRW